MQLHGSCQCGKIRFSLTSAHPYPYQRCYCSICRKTQGGGGYAINLGGEAKSLKVEGREAIRIHHAVMHDRNGSAGAGESRISTAERHFCGQCGTGLWLFSPEWPDLIHPFASAIDTPLPVPPDLTHIMLADKAPWVVVEAGPNDRQHQEYPDESIAQWHERHGLVAAD